MAEIEVQSTKAVRFPLSQYVSLTNELVHDMPLELPIKFVREHYWIYDIINVALSEVG